MSKLSEKARRIYRDYPPHVAQREQAKMLLALADEIEQMEQEAKQTADMLEFFFDQMQSHSLKMDGQHSYRFRSGWPMTHCVGPNRKDAVKAAIAEIERSHAELLRDVDNALDGADIPTAGGQSDG